jgi:hypothetical protein
MSPQIVGCVKRFIAPFEHNTYDGLDSHSLSRKWKETRENLEKVEELVRNRGFRGFVGCLQRVVLMDQNENATLL